METTLTTLDALATLHDWNALPSERRLKVARSLADALGPGFTADPTLHGPKGFAGVIHQATGIVFLAIPGGEYMMGMTHAELSSALEFLDDDEEAAREPITAQAACSMPSHAVRVRPFLCALTPVLRPVARAAITMADADADRPYFDADEDAPVPAHLTRIEAVRLAHELRLRLLCEAEWEWVAREGGAVSWLHEDPTSAAWSPFPVAEYIAEHSRFDRDSPDSQTLNGFGLWGLLFGEWVSDGWHADYEGAPSCSLAWEPRALPEIVRAFGAATYYPWQSPVEFVACHAAFRSYTGDPRLTSGVRLAIDLPPEKGF